MYLEDCPRMEDLKVHFVQGTKQNSKLSIYIVEYICQFLHDIKMPKGTSAAKAAVT